MSKTASALIVMLLFFCLPFIALSTGYVNVSVFEAKAMIDSNPSLVVLDVRNLGEYDSGHIRNAVHIPVSELEGRLDELNTAAEILVYCLSGGRSATASQILADNGFLYVYNMLGGITAWKNEGYPVYVKYSSIQEAINNADEEDTIYVSVGTYYENLIVNKTISLLGEDEAETIIDGGEINSSIRVSANNVVINNFTVQNGYWEAVCIWDYSNVTIINNILIHSTFGIRIANGQNNTITDNIILSNGYGIQVAGWSAWSNTIASNTLINNTWGIEIHDVGGSNIIEDNIIISSSTSLHLSNSHGNIVYRNKIVGSSDSGIMLDYSNGNSIRENNIIGSGYYSISVVSSSNSYIFHNNFINGTNQVHLADSNNTWDNACEGNYWSNYNGTDLDGDGIGDTYLPWEGVDNYPLMNPYWKPGDINHDLKIDIYDVVRITAIYSSQEGDDNWNPHADIAEPYGIIDIYDVVTCTKDYGQEYNNP